MTWLYGLIGAAILGGYLFVHYLRVKRTRRVEAYVAREEAAHAEDAAGPLLPPEVTRDMIQNGEDKRSGEF